MTDITACNIVVMKGGGNQVYKRILVPLAGGPNGAFALEIASILADKAEGAITAFTVAGQRDAFKIVAFLKENEELLQISRDKIVAKSVFHHKG